jgi:endonuclease-3 related protein
MATGRGSSAEQQVLAFYLALTQTWGPQNWWPARTRFEVIAGAYLTQNTAWTNVQLALKCLRHARALSVSGIRRLSTAELERLIRPAGYFRQKAERLKQFVNFLDVYYGGSLARMFAQPTENLRRELLSLKGIGPETADSMLLYGGNHPVFVVDTYTRRIAERHGIFNAQANYEDIRSLFEKALASDRATRTDTHGFIWINGDRHSKTGKDIRTLLPSAEHSPSYVSSSKRPALTQMFNEMHALFVGVGKRYCLKAEPHCQGCPLERFLPRK